MSERVRVGAVDQLPDGQGVFVLAAGNRVAVFRVGDSIYAIGDRCSHAEASLAEGEVFGDAVECPRHGSEFDLTTGEPNSLPATSAVPIYPVEIGDDGEVFITVEPEEEG